MQECCKPSPFSLAGQSFSSALPKAERIADDDLVKIKIPGWRYDAINEAVLKMYEKTNARVIPLPVLDIVVGLGYSIIPYRSFGPCINNELKRASQDAVTMQFRGSDRPIILYNDRRSAQRINFSIMHEVGHNELGHQEQSPLAEIEANHFAAVALCPSELLEHYDIAESQTVAQLFNISDECARNRIEAARNRRGAQISSSGIRFRRAVVERFKFKHAYQVDLFRQNAY